jgi:hypothetical protein
MARVTPSLSSDVPLQLTQPLMDFLTTEADDVAGAAAPVVTLGATAVVVVAGLVAVAVAVAVAVVADVVADVVWLLLVADVPAVPPAEFDDPHPTTGRTNIEAARRKRNDVYLSKAIFSNLASHMPMAKDGELSKNRSADALRHPPLMKRSNPCLHTRRGAEAH